MSLLTLEGFGQRASSFRFELLDKQNTAIESSLDVDMDSPPGITNNINRVIKRSMDGLTLPPSVTAEIDTLTDRIKPWMRMQDGTEYPLGVFLFADASRRLVSSGSVQFSPAGDAYSTHATCLDQGAILNQGTRGVAFFGPGHNLHDAIVQHFETAGIVDFHVDDTSAVISDWVVWKPNTNRLKIMNELCQMAGFYSVYFDNSGVGQARKVPSMAAVEPTLVYDAGTNVFADSIVETDDILDAPNTYVVVNTGFTEGAVWGEWQVPASAPHSVANRGYHVVKEIDMQGIESNAQAALAAKAYGQADYATYRWVNFSTAIDPRHDTFDVVGWKGEKYREQQWSIQAMVEGSAQAHELRRVWSDEFDDLLEEIG